MSTYEPGTVAAATVMGVEGVRVFRTDDPARPWITALCEHRHGAEVTDVRPLVVLDIDAANPDADRSLKIEHLVDALRKDGRYISNTYIADQIEAQTKPAEPTGLGAVVEASDGQTWVRRHPGGYAWVNGYQRWAEYDDINAVRVLSEGVPA